jgi:chromosome segregation ATPase
MIFNSPPLSAELNKKGFVENNGTIATSPGEEKKPKRHSNSPLFIQSPSPKQENVKSELEKLIGTVNDLETDNVKDEENNQELLTEIDKLKEQLAQSETAYQVLSQNQTALKQDFQKTLKANEELINQVNQAKLQGEAREKYLQEEIDEFKYKLAESQKKVKDQEKEVEELKLQVENNDLE